MCLKKGLTHLVAVDVGNTRTHFGVFKGQCLLRTFSVPTHEHHARIPDAIGNVPQRTTAGVICSVVPQKNRVLRAHLKSRCGGGVGVLGKDLPIPIRNRTSKPSQVGADRLVNALAAYRRVGRALVVVDFGTAVTFDVVSGRGEYLGGAIAPGIELTLKALAEKTALLPRIELRHVNRAVGRTTFESMRSGCAFGLGFLCDGLLKRFDEELLCKHRVIATGGYARFMQRYSRRIRDFDPNLTLKGIRIAATGA
ncbi:MAG: type III pantothenate kinase [Candidatus Omnitrophica bacterium]|nr:type III pantothenate kinase [Candidatus Omnitrophota bacterium]